MHPSVLCKLRMLAEDAELAERAAYLFSMEQLVLPDVFLASVPSTRCSGGMEDE